MQFKKRLKERMNQKSIDTKEFAKRLYNYGSDSDLWESYEKKSTDIRKIQKWLKGNNEPKNIDELRKICDILDCDFSYLLGDSPIANFNNKKVGEWLGLDEIVVSNIKGYDKATKLFMTLLVRAAEYNNRLEDILKELIRILRIHANNSSYKTITIKDDITGDVDELKNAEAFHHTMSITQSMMEPILYEVALLGMDINKKSADIQRKQDEENRKKEIEKILNNIMAITGKSKKEILEDIENNKTK